MPTSPRAKTAVVIGGGFGGLGSACLLAKAGWNVTLVEKNEQLGGRCSILRKDGFLFDMGPSWYLMPDVFAQFFSLLGEDVHSLLDLKRLDPSYRIRFAATGKTIDVRAALDDNKALFESLEPGCWPTVLSYLEKSRRTYDISMRSFVYRNYDGILDFLNKETAVEGRGLPIFRSMESHVAAHFRSDEMRKIMLYQMVFLGSDPAKTPAMYSLMNHIDFSMGVFYPQGGLHTVIDALEGIARKHGADLRTNSPASAIEVKDGVVRGVRLASGEFLEADTVISNADVHHTDTALLPPEARMYSEKYWRTRTLAPSALILYLGVKGRIPAMTHHNLLFASDWKRNFQEIFDDPKWPTEPSLYICAPSVTDPSVAPPDHENLFVLVPIAPRMQDDDATVTAYADRIIDVIAREYDVPDLKERIVVREHFCGKDFAARYHSLGGTALGLAHTLGQTAIFRPRNHSTKAKGLYYAGAGTVPGIGMPMCLISAQLAYKRIVHDRSTGPLTHL